jgi:hypothetical protein
VTLRGSFRADVASSRTRGGRLAGGVPAGNVGSQFETSPHANSGAPIEAALSLTLCKVKRPCSYRAGPLAVLFDGSDCRLGPFLPPVATKLTHSPWFLNTPNDIQPPLLH